MKNKSKFYPGGIIKRYIKNIFSYFILLKSELMLWRIREK